MTFRWALRRRQPRDHHRTTGAASPCRPHTRHANLHPTSTSRQSEHGSVVTDGRCNYQPNASMRACSRLDPHLTRLTQAAVPSTVWRVVDRNRRADLAPSLAKHPESTAEADEAKTGSRDALAGRERLPWVSSSPRTRGLKMPTSGLWCGRVACLYEKVRPGPSCTGPPRPPS